MSKSTKYLVPHKPIQMHAITIRITALQLVNFTRRSLDKNETKVVKWPQKWLLKAKNRDPNANMIYFKQPRVYTRENKSRTNILDTGSELPKK